MLTSPFLPEAPHAAGLSQSMYLAAEPGEEHLSFMLVGIAVVLLCAAIFGRLATRLGQPAVIGEIFAGILLGPSLLGMLPGNPTELLFPNEARPLLSAIAQVGLLLFMFVVGWEFDRRLIRPYVGLAAGVSLSSIILPFGLGIALATVVHPHHSIVAGQPVPFLPFALFLGAAMSVTAFPVLARILVDRGIQRTKIGSLALASAAIDDVLAWCILALISIVIVSEGKYTDLMWVGGLSVLFVLLMVLMVRPALARVISWGAVHDRWSTLVMLVGAGALFSAWMTSMIGIHAIFGAFLFGFIMPREQVLSATERLRRPFENTGQLLLPLFFIVTGLNVDLGALAGRDYLTLVLILTVACMGKLIGALVPARLSGFSWRDAADLGVLMNTRGLTELVILNVGISMGLLDDRIFTMLVIMALVTTVMAGPLLSQPQRKQTRMQATPPDHVASSNRVG